MRLLENGQELLGTYRVERLLGEGAFAEVYRVRNTFLDRREAMKVFKAVLMTEDDIGVLLGEAVLLTRIEHPNIIRVYAAGTVPTCGGVAGYFTMEYVSGGTLDRFWQSHGPRFVPVETSLDIICQVSEGVSRAHAEQPPIIHRDIKPQNILIGYDGKGLRAKISDFGLAKRVDPLGLFASGRGTLAFKPPEVFEGADQDSTAGDVWAIGSVLYLLLTDRLPFSGLDDSDTIDGSRFLRPLIPPSRLNIGVDPSLDQIVSRALAVRRQDRYPSSAELLHDLMRWRQRPRSGPAKAAAMGVSAASSGSPKSALGERSPLSTRRPDDLAKEALVLAGDAERLAEAADLMEQAINMEPALRGRYEPELQRWRRRLDRGKGRDGKESRVVAKADPQQAREMASTALKLGRQYGELKDAIRLMDMAIRDAPELADDYRDLLDLWKRGIAQ